MKERKKKEEEEEGVKPRHTLFYRRNTASLNEGDDSLTYCREEASPIF